MTKETEKEGRAKETETRKHMKRENENKTIMNPFVTFVFDDELNGANWSRGINNSQDGIG